MSYYAIQAFGGLNIQFKNVVLRPQAEISLIDLTNSFQVEMDVRYFNHKLGILKDSSNQHVLYSPRFVDADGGFSPDTFDISAADFADQFDVSAGAGRVVSVGFFRDIYTQFYSYVRTYFGTAYGFASLYDTSAIYSITNIPMTEATAQQLISTDTSAISGVIDFSNINQILRAAVDGDHFNNRAAPSAADWYFPTNYGVGDGFVAGDLVFLANGITIRLWVDIDRETFLERTNNIGSSTIAAQYDQTFNYVSPNGYFSVSTTANVYHIERTISAPLAIKMINRDPDTSNNLSITPTAAFSTTAQPPNITLDWSAAPAPQPRFVIINWGAGANSSGAIYDTSYIIDVSLTDSVVSKVDARHILSFYITPYTDYLYGVGKSTILDVPIVRIIDLEWTDVSYQFARYILHGIYSFVSVYSDANVSAIDISAGGLGVGQNITIASGGDEFVGLTPYTRYDVSFVPRDERGWAYDTYYSYVYTAPKLYSFAATDISYDYVRLVWSGYYNTTSVVENGIRNVYLDYGGGSGVFNDISYVVANLVPYTNYTFTITPTDNTARTYEPHTIETYTKPIIQSVFMTDISYTFARINWTGYYNTANIYINGALYVAAAAGGGLATYNNVFYVATGLLPYTAYLFRIKPTDQTNTEFGESSAVAIKTSPIIYTITITNVLTTQTTATLNLNWTGAYPAVNIYQNSVFFTSSAAATLVRTGLTAGATYVYRVVPIDDNLVEYTQITQTVVVPTAPTITAANSTQTSIQVIFAAPTVGGTVSQYIAYTSTGIQNTGTSSPITITGLARKTAYTVYVRANFTSGYSSISASRSSTTK